jgi:RNA recognition motif-containing protein
MAREIYVGHISENATEEDVRKLFSVMGVVTSVHLIIDPETREFKRCGYVRMAADVDLNDVVETLDGALLVDRVITVSIARPQKPGMSAKPSKFGGGRKPGSSGLGKSEIGKGQCAGGRGGNPSPGGERKAPRKGK